MSRRLKGKCKGYMRAVTSGDIAASISFNGGEQVGSFSKEHQEDISRLLNKTLLEMHAAVQPDGYSPKSVDSSTSVQQLKPGSESVDNSGNAISSHAKGKKRLRNDQSMEFTKGDQVTDTTLKRDRGAESTKREHSTKPDDGGAITFKFGNFNAEITKITEKGGLVSIEEVEHLLNLMQPDVSEKKIDMAGRMMLAGKIAATERHDCLVKFVQLRGVPVLDEWLQEVHKGKTENGTNPRESDKLAEEFLLSLLKALEKLPISLNTLQTSNIGKSVNYLRSHKNLEVQRKARGLVDTWKKRVDAEMSKINEGKSFGSSQSVSCTVKGYSDVSHAGHKRGGSTETAAKVPARPTACKALPGKPGVLDSNKKSNLSAPVAVSLKDPDCKVTVSNGCSELPPATINEDSASCQSQNSNQCPSDEAQLIVSSLKEEARSSAAGSDNTSKQVGSPSRYREPNNGLLVTDVPETDKEAHSGGGSDSVDKVLTAEKTSQSALACDKPLGMAAVNHGNSNSLIVRLSNPSRSPGKSGSEGRSEDPLVMDNRAFSPAVTDKQDHSDNKIKSTSDVPWGNVTADANTELRKGNDVKESMVGTEAVRSSVIFDGELTKNIEEVGKVTHPPNTALAVGDDTGMNLLTTVAAGEISVLTDLVGTSPSLEDVCTGTSERKSSLSCEDDIIQRNVLHDEPASVDSEKQGKFVDCISADHISRLGKTKFTSSSVCATQLQNLQDDKSTVDQTTQPIISCMNCLEKVDSSVKVEAKLEEEKIDEAACKPAKEELDDYGVALLKDKQITDAQLLDVNACDVSISGRKLEMSLSEEPMLSTVAKELPSGDSPTDQQTRDALDERTDTVVSLPADSVPSPKATDDYITLKSVHLGVNHIELTHEGKEQKNASPSRSDELVRSATVSHVPAEIVGGLKKSHETCSVESDRHEEPSSFTIKETENPAKFKTSGFAADANDKLALSAEQCLSIIPAKQDVATKLELDLNEGISGDDGNQSQLVLAASLCSSAVHLPKLSSFSNPKLNDFPSTITVASPAKRPFVPPEILSMTKSEPGWKGSAATSAFRPAEPRKIMEMPSNILDILPSYGAGKQSRPLVDIDLNVADEEVLDDMTFQNTTRLLGITGSHESPARSAGGVDLDLNRVDDGMGNGQFMASTSCRMKMPLLPMQPESAEFSGRGANVLRNFDLNDRPSSDEVCLKTGASNQLANYLSIPNLAPVADYRAYKSEAGHVSPWYRSNPYPVIVAPSLLFERGEQSNTAVAGSQKILGPVTGGGILGSDIYKGSALLSSPPMVVSQTTALSYANLPFPPKFPIASTSLSDGSTNFVDPPFGSGSCFPAFPSLLVGPAGSVSHHQRPHVINFPECSTSGASDNTLKWSRQGFDLNTGPGSGDLEEKDEKLSSASKQLLLPTSHAFTDDQTRMMYRPLVLGLKRKEPEWSQDADRPAKQLSWKQGDY